MNSGCFLRFFASRKRQTVQRSRRGTLLNGDQASRSISLSLVQKEPFDALHLPGGVLNPDSLRTNGEAVFFVKRFFFDEGRPVSALCHAPWTLITADVVKGRTLTSDLVDISAG